MTHPALEAPGPGRSDEVPLVSVVIICYNHGRFLANAVESVLAQTMGDVEVIVVDDGSTDDTPAVAARYPSVRYLRQRNQGMSAARNAGFRVSRGRFVSFLDADDRLLPGALGAGAACLQEHPECAFVSGRYRMISADGQPIPTAPPPSVRTDHYRALLENNYIGMHATVLFRREALQSASGFDSSLRACDDYEIYLRIARESPVSSHDDVVAEYRWHGANTSRNWRLMLRSTLRPLRAQRRHVRGNPVREAAYRRGIHNWQRSYGDPLLTETLAGLRDPKRWGSAALGLGTLLRYYPRGLWRRLLGRVAPPEDKARDTGFAGVDSVRPRVSVIIPCYNQARYLGEAIGSALAQSARPGLEVVVVDDGSSDATRSVAESFPEVRFIHQENRGTAAARNLGFRSSRGEFIVFLDADDRLLPGAVEAGMRQLDEHPECGFAYGFVNVIRPDGSLSSRPGQDAVESEHYLRLLRHNYIWTPGAVFYRREAVESVGGFRAEAGGAADFDLNLRIARIFPVRCHGETVLDYRDHPSSQSSNAAAMLRSAVRVRRAQKGFVRGRRDFEAALNDGVREDRAYYGARLAGDIGAQLKARRWKEALSGLLTLLVYDPRRLIRHAVGRPA